MKIISIVNQKGKEIKSTPFVNHKHGVDFFIGNSKLTILDKMLPNIRGGEFILEEVIKSLDKDYDYVIIDCMPSVGLLTENALCCCHSVIIPTEPQYFSVKGIQSLISEIFTIKKRYNPKLEIAGILPTKVHYHTKLAKEFIATIDDIFGRDFHIFFPIPTSVKISEASKGANIFKYDRRCKGKVAYSTFATDFLRRDNL